MIRNYFKIAFRTLFRSKLYTTLNVAGLTFGLTCFILIGLFLFDELTFDTQHSNVNRIYRVIEHRTTNGEATTIAGAGYKLAEQSKTKIAEVDNTTSMVRTGRANLVNPDNPVPFQETVTIADENLLTIFDFPLLQGDSKTALREPNSIIINEDLAKRLFGRTDVMGKMLDFQFTNNLYKITGILKNHPKNSSFDFNSVLSLSTFLADTGYRNSRNVDWLSNDFSVYVLLKPNTKPQAVEGKMAKLVKDNFRVPAGTDFSFRLQPLKDLHLKSEDIQDGARNSNVEAMAKGSVFYIKLFSFIALFVLLIAGINYMNLTTAKASSRLKEIGVRKTIGAFKIDLVRQFLLESLLVTFISFLLSILLVNLILPGFNAFTGKQLSFNLNTDYRIWLLAIGFAAISGFLSGSYPALMLSRFRPVSLLKGLKLNNRYDLTLRKSLVIIQFTISVIMIIGTIVLFLQVKFLNNTDLGFNKNLMVVIDVNTGRARSNSLAVKTEMQKIPAVKSVSITSRVPGEWKSFRTLKMKAQGSPNDPHVSYMFGADEDFLSTFEVKLLNGRNFNSPGDTNNILINEAAAKLLGIKEAGGQTVEISAISRGESFSTLDKPILPKVVGIVKDFHFQTLRSKIEPLILMYRNNPIHLIDYYTCKIAPTDIQTTLDKLKAIMVANDKDDPFEYHFLDDQLALFYVEDGRRQTILIWVALSTIFIACLGLFGLATYSAEQRVKEIGVRKVLGASVAGLASLLSKDFLKLVLIANGIAFPIAWWATSQWLQEYAYHIDVEWWIFVVAGLAAVLIAIITVSYQAIRAAMMNPVKSLRSE